MIFLVSETLNEGGTFILLNNKKITVYKYVYINRIRLLTGCFLRGNRTLFFHLKCYLCASNKKNFFKMTKADIIDKIAKSTGAEKVQVSSIVEAFMENVKGSWLRAKMFI